MTNDDLGKTQQLLQKVTKLKIPLKKRNTFPFSTPIVSTFKSIAFKYPVTFFVGENGTGKSTLLEGIAASCNLPIIGSRNINEDETLKNAHELSKFLKLSWSIKTNKGFFLRAEDFFGFTKRLNQLRVELSLEIRRLDAELPDGYGKNLAIGSIKGQIENLTSRYGVDLDAGSHGESFLKLFQTRIKPNGLYLLDEPETPLSPTRQMSLLKILDDAVKQNCQFIIVTHSPIVMSYPKAVILDFNTAPIKQIDYDHVDHVNIFRDFISNRELYLKELFER